MMSSAVYILSNMPYFILLIGALVFFHELGHFAVAKACGIKVTRFSLGFGPRLFKFTYGETEYTLSLLPFGGYVKMLGEGVGNEAEGADSARAFSNKPLLHRCAVVLAGPVANFILAVVIYFCMFIGPHTFGDTKLGVVTEGEPAWQAGIRPGDRIVAVFNKPIAQWEDLRDAIIAHPDQNLQVTYERDNKRIDTMVQTQSRHEQNAFQEQESRGKIGVSLMYLRPQLAVVDSQSPAAKAGIKTGDLITAVNGHAVQAWFEVKRAVAEADPKAPMALTLRRGTSDINVTLTPEAPLADLPQELYGSADVPGGYTGLTNRNALIVRVDKDTPAAKAGLQAGDRLLSVAIKAPNAAPIVRNIGMWEVDLAPIGFDPKSELTLTYQRERTVAHQSLFLAAEHRSDDLKNEQTSYVMGAYNDSLATTSTYTYDRPIYPIEALGESVKQVGEDMTMIATGIKKMFQGALPVSSMGGPIMLFVIAERSASQGRSYFLRTLCMVSVNLGMLNLVPVPVLDGGHLLFFAIEAITRRTPSIKIREYANLIGLGLVLMLMVLVFKNDLMRFVIS